MKRIGKFYLNLHNQNLELKFTYFHTFFFYLSSFISFNSSFWSWEIAVHVDLCGMDLFGMVTENQILGSATFEWEPILKEW